MNIWAVGLLSTGFKGGYRGGGSRMGMRKRGRGKCVLK